MKFPATVVAILHLFALAAADGPSESRQVVYGQLICYGDGFQKFLTGAKVSIEQHFGCQECTGPTLTYGGVPGVYVFLSSREAHIFINGSLHQSLPLDDCSPSYLYHSVSNPERIWIQCKSSPPSYTPMYNRIDRSDIDTWTIVRRTKPGSDISYAEDPNNAIITGGRFGRWNDDIVVAMVRGRPEVAIFPDSFVSDPVVYSLADYCDNLATLHASQLYDESNFLQFVVDCVSSNVTKRWVITLNAFLVDAIDPYQLPHTGGAVSVTQDGGHFLIHDTSQIFLVNRYDHDSVEPAVMNFGSVITGVQQVRGDLLIESPGKNRTLLNVTEFTSSTAEEGLTTLPQSETYCPDRVCPPSVVIQDKYLVVFTQELSYLLALVYDLDDPLSEPFVVDKIFIATFPRVCFYVEGETVLFTLDRSSGEETATTPTLPPPPSSTTIEPRTNGLKSGDVVGIVIAAVIAFFVIVGIVCTILAIIKFRQKSKVIKRNDSTMMRYSPDLKQKQDISLEKEDKAELSSEKDESENHHQGMQELPEIKTPEVTDENSGSITSSGFDGSSRESSRLSTPVPPSDQKKGTSYYLSVGGQTSDYYSSRETTPSLTPSLTPSGSPLLPHYSRIICSPDMQQDGTYLAGQSKLVVSDTAPYHVLPPHNRQKIRLPDVQQDGTYSAGRSKLVVSCTASKGGLEYQVSTSCGNQLPITAEHENNGERV